jgi:hypothetical protein
VLVCNVHINSIWFYTIMYIHVHMHVKNSLQKVIQLIDYFFCSPGDLLITD